MQVDYKILSEQYAGFLSALGGVSITVLALVLSLDYKSKLRPPLIAALVVGTLSAFTGAHLMAETAAFISATGGSQSGARLFLLASINIYISVVLAIFALMLLPAEPHEEKPDQASQQDAINIRRISVWVFRCVLASAGCWMLLTAIIRMQSSQRYLSVSFAVVCGLFWFYFLWNTKINKLLPWSFITIAFTTTISLLLVAVTFHYGGDAHYLDIFFFSSAILFSCVSLFVCSWRLLPKKAETLNSQDQTPATE